MFCPNSQCSESSHDPLCLHLMISSHRALAAFPKDNRMWIEETHLRYRIMKPCPKFRSMSSPLRFCFRIFKGITPQNKKSQSIGNIYVMIRPKLGTVSKEFICEWECECVTTFILNNTPTI